MSISSIKTAKRMNEVKLKILIILIAILQPIIILSVLGSIDSMSMSWGTVLQPLFIFTNATTSFYFFQIKEWRAQALFLMLLTAFSVNLFPNLHNFFAVMFFIGCIFGMTRGSYYRLFIVLYLLSIPIFIFSNLFWAEFYAILILCAYHLRLLCITNKIKVLK